MKRVLLTGANGFVGLPCVQALARRGYEVHAVALGPYEADDATWYDANLLDAQARSDLFDTIQPTHLLHFAWITTPGVYWTSTQNLEWVSASLDLLRLCERNHVSRVVMAGSCAEYSWDHSRLQETQTPLEPATLYGTCKHALQTVLASWSEQTGIPSAWGRIFFLYGRNEHPNRLVSSVIRSLLSGKEANCSAGEQIRDFMHNHDTADAFAALLDSTVCGPLNVSYGEAVPIKDIVMAIAKQIDATDLVRLGALASRPDDPPELSASVNRLRDEVDWTPTFTLEEGLADTIAWWKQELENV